MTTTLVMMMITTTMTMVMTITTMKMMVATIDSRRILRSMKRGRQHREE